jgi:uncharacterized protein (TIGR02246 family)
MTDDHQRIRALFESGCVAWNRGDIDGYLADYGHSDKVRWVSEGTVRYGFEAIAAGFKVRFDSPDNMGRLEVANLEIQLLGESDALVFGAWIQTTRTARHHGAFTVHLKKIDGEWLIVSDHSSTSG